MTPRPPTPRQLAYLRLLAERTGQTFTPPKTIGQASREIRRLQAQPHSTGADLAAERRHARDQSDEDVYATAPLPDEISGFGSSHATWRTAR